MNDQIKGVAEFWGDEMPMMAMEEAGELIQAISKLERYYNGKGIREQDTEANLRTDLIKEMADVEIAIRALLEHYDMNYNLLKTKVGDKLNKKY